MHLSILPISTRSEAPRFEIKVRRLTAEEHERLLGPFRDALAASKAAPTEKQRNRLSDQAIDAYERTLVAAFRKKRPQRIVVDGKRLSSKLAELVQGHVDSLVKKGPDGRPAVLENGNIDAPPSFFVDIDNRGHKDHYAAVDRAVSQVYNRVNTYNRDLSVLHLPLSPWTFRSPKGRRRPIPPIPFIKRK